LDTDFLTGKLQIGTLTHDRSAIRFVYDPSWLTAIAFAQADAALSET